MEQQELYPGRAVRINQDYMGEYKGKAGVFAHLDTTHDDGDWYGIEFADKPGTIVYFWDKEFDVIETAAEKYNREMDERNHINFANRDKPWLPLYDGE